VFASQAGTPLLDRNVPRRYLDPVMAEIDRDDTPTLDLAIELPASLREFAAAPGRA
jgi:hypothetical protein